MMNVFVGSRHHTLGLLDKFASQIRMLLLNETIILAFKKNYNSETYCF